VPELGKSGEFVYSSSRNGTPVIVTKNMYLYYYYYYYYYYS